MDIVIQIGVRGQEMSTQVAQEEQFGRAKLREGGTGSVFNPLSNSVPKSHKGTQIMIKPRADVKSLVASCCFSHD